VKALSIRQPWVFSILHGGKDIENRDWPTRYRGPLALHAAKGMTRADVEAWRLFIDYADLRGDWLDGRTIGDLDRGGVVGVCDLVDCVSAHASPWFTGDYGFVLANVRPIDFLPCAGRLGLFDLPADVQAIIDQDLSL